MRVEPGRRLSCAGPVLPWCCRRSGCRPVPSVPAQPSRRPAQVTPALASRGLHSRWQGPRSPPPVRCVSQTGTLSCALPGPSCSGHCGPAGRDSAFGSAETDRLPPRTPAPSPRLGGVGGRPQLMDQAAVWVTLSCCLWGRWWHLWVRSAHVWVTSPAGLSFPGQPNPPLAASLGPTQWWSKHF